VEDGQTIVLGGLLEDNLVEGKSQVPILGSIPLIGNLFKARNSTKKKTNLLVFIKPTILRNGTQATIETNSKYNFLRDMQLERNGGKASLQLGERQPILPELSNPTTTESKPVDPSTGLTTTPLEDTPAAK
jgi:general secretion pathway protein D